MKLFRSLGLLFIVIYVSFYGNLFAKEWNIQNITSLDQVEYLSKTTNTKDLWYVKNELIEPNLFKDKIDLSSWNSDDWRPYSPPGSIYIEHPDWEGSEYLSILKLWKAPSHWETPHLSIRVGVISDKDKVYINGNLIGEHGSFDSDEPEGYDKIRVYRIPTEMIHKGELNTILILNKPFFQYTAGIEQDSIKLGPSQLIEGNFLRDEYVKIFLLMIYSTVAGYFFFLFVRRRKDYENLFFGLFTFSLVLYQFLRNQLKYELGIDFLVLKKIEYLVLMMLIPFMYHFLRSYFKYKYHLVYKIADSIISLAFIFILVTGDVTYYDLLNKNLIQPIWIAYVFMCIFYLVQQSIRKDLDAILMLIGFVVLIFSATMDILSTRNVIVFPRVSGYAFLVLILSIATILANKFVRLNVQVEELNANLEKKVIKRTEELNTTLEEVKKLKVQQDGDYFLTSLLLNPLITNTSMSEKFKIAFFTKQKKDFEFKGKKHEIGGDISISSNIELKGKKYIVFINGDAMGKSMQGAGGALVLGVVFNAVLTRSNAESNKNKHPEVWLKEAFMDLQRVFESFNGSMLISIVLGIIEEDSGMMYYINAEHPWTVLYRDGKAEFLENELFLRKLGFPGNEESFFVRTYQLKPGDVLLAGSDGRDDILLGHDADGTRIINEDEEKFVTVVEEAKSEIPEIVRILEKQGEYTDDITLVRIEYLDSEKDNFEFEYTTEKPLYDKGKELIRQGKLEEGVKALEESIDKEKSQLDLTFSLIGQTYFKLKQWDKALLHLEKSIEIKSSNSDILFYASYSAKMDKKLLKASELGERCYLRDPSNSKNLVNLADIYKRMNKLERALHLVSKALNEEPNNRNALRLKELLEA
jgi:tetratricopeptide (TPR) repeat protein